MLLSYQKLTNIATRGTKTKPHGASNCDFFYGNSELDEARKRMV